MAFWSAPLERFPESCPYKDELRRIPFFSIFKGCWVCEERCGVWRRIHLRVFLLFKMSESFMRTQRGKSYLALWPCYFAWGIWKTFTQMMFKK
jgi:hypothetical protein